jgi:hypothetical protein
LFEICIAQAIDLYSGTIRTKADIDSHRSKAVPVAWQT